MNKDIQKKVQDKLDNEKAADIVNQMKNHPVELKIDIPDDPFIEKQDEILPDDGEGLDGLGDDDENLTAEDFDLIEQEIGKMDWGVDKDTNTIKDLMYKKEIYFQRAFYCFVCSRIDDDNLVSYMHKFGKMIRNTLNRDLKNKVHKDSIQTSAKELSNNIVNKLLGWLEMKPKKSS
jgi:hypothetical protein